MKLLANNFMETTPSKNLYILLQSFTNTAVIPAYLKISNVHINCYKEIKLLDITVGDNLTLETHVDILFYV